MVNALMGLTIIVIIKAIVLWLYSLILKWKKNGLGIALLVCGLSFYPLYILTIVIPIELHQSIIISRLIWSLPVLIPLILIKLFYRSSWITIALPVVIFILIDHFLRPQIYNLVFSFIPLT